MLATAVRMTQIEIWDIWPMRNSGHMILNWCIQIHEPDLKFLPGTREYNRKKLTLPQKIGLLLIQFLGEGGPTTLVIKYSHLI